MRVETTWYRDASPLADLGAVGTFQSPQVRRALAREPRQGREGSSAKRSLVSLRETWGTHFVPT